MPTVNLNRKEFERLVGKKLSLDKLKDRISMLGTDLEDITEKEIIVEVFPNRPDMLSEQGFARAFSSFIGVKKGLRKYEAKKSDYKLIVEDSVKNVRPYTACAVVKNLNFNDEKIKQVIQIQEKLHVGYGRNRKKCAIGIYPLEKIKFPIYYKALEPNKIKFRPLESSKEMNGYEILSKHPTGKEYGYLLQNKKKFPIFIDSNNKILSMPPIINSEDTGKITNKTKEVFIEVSGFDYSTINKCLTIIVCALADMKGVIYKIELNYNNKKIISPYLKPESMKININYVIK
jgi:phenylalanyl-tRNA synthetase beta chain